MPLTGARALGAEVPWEREAWVPAFLNALAGEAADGLQRLAELERAWFAARSAVAGRRRHSPAPLLSATSLASGLGMAVKNATVLLDNLANIGIAVEVTHRAKRRLSGAGPRPGAASGPPRRGGAGASSAGPLTPVERWIYDYTALDRWMAQAEQAMRQTRRTLDALAWGNDPAPAEGVGNIGS